MSRFLQLKHFRRLSRHLNSYLQRSNTLIGTKIVCLRLNKSVSYGSKFIVLFQTLRTVIIMNDQTDERSTSASLDVDAELQQALEHGDTAILNLMEQLKNFVVVISEEYRTCLKKQMEIMERASSTGPFSEVWDEIPQYRTLADELEKELNEYMTVFNTLGRMAGENTLVQFVSGSCENLGLVAMKYKELDELLKQEIEENKKVHLEFLQIERDVILKEAST